MITTQWLIRQELKSPDSSGAYVRIDIQTGKNNEHNIDYARIHYSINTFASNPV